MKKNMMLTIGLLLTGFSDVCLADGRDVAIVSIEQETAFNKVVTIYNGGISQDDKVENKIGNSKYKNSNQTRESKIEQGSVLKALSRQDRKVVCLKLMNSFVQDKPRLAYVGAECLLYSGDGLLAIEFFAEFIANGYDKKFFNGRMGYSWMHFADWFNVGDSVLSKMTGGMDLYSWTAEKIQNEILSHPNKYSQYKNNPIGTMLKQVFRVELKNKPLTTQQISELKVCKNIFVHLRDLTCEIDKKNKKQFINCVQDKTLEKPLLDCQ